MAVRTQAYGQTLLVTLDRPESRNAVDGATAKELFEVFSDFDKNSSFNAAVLTGANGTFSSGADLKATGSGSGNRVESDISQPGPLGCTRMLLSKPVVAAVEGFAVAGGLELAIWCDLRVAATNSIFGVYCRRWGVPLIDGGTIRLPRLIGQSRALDMILTGRGVTGEEAYQWGLANRLVEPGETVEAAVELAQTMGNFPQNCLRSDRMSVHEQWGMSLDQALANETRYGLGTIATGEASEGAARFAGGAGRHGEGLQ